jgi:hypothetical protein
MDDNISQMSNILRQPRDIFVQKWLNRDESFQSLLKSEYQGFIKELINNPENIERFEISQHCNPILNYDKMGNAFLRPYTRCFYKLKDNETIFMDVPLTKPKVGFHDGHWRVNKKNDGEALAIIKKHFTKETGSDECILVFTRR